MFPTLERKRRKIFEKKKNKKSPFQHTNFMDDTLNNMITTHVILNNFVLIFVPSGDKGCMEIIEGRENLHRVLIWDTIFKIFRFISVLGH